MMLNRKNISNVVRGGLCLQCGICISICPNSCISLKRDDKKNYIPVINEKCCKICELCIKACPGYGVNFKNIIRNHNQKAQSRKHPLLGEYLSVFLGFSQEANIRQEATSGGIIPTILLYLLEAGKIDGALVVRSKDNDPYNPEVFIAKTKQEIFDSMNAKYHPVCLSNALSEIDSIQGKYAIVGLPCHIHGILKYVKLRKLERNIYLTLGLFCGLNLRFDSLEFFVHKVKQDIEDLKEVVYRTGGWPGRTILKFKGSESCSINKNIVNHIFTVPRCLFCIDHTNELADISCGDAWIQELLQKNDAGWSAIICRSSVGNEILDELRNRNLLLLDEVNINKVIESQYPMLCFKKKNSWMRMRINQILGKDIPNYDIEYYYKNFNLNSLIGNSILIFVINLMKCSKFKSLLKNLPLQVLKFYEIMIIRLLYKDNFLNTIIDRIDDIFRSKKIYIHFLKIFNIYKKSKEKYKNNTIILFPFILLYKIIKKMLLFNKNILEYGIYTFYGRNNYDISYLKKITGIRNEYALMRKIKDNKSLFFDRLDNSTLKKYIELFPGGRKEIINQAKLVCDHVFDLLGSGPKKLSPDGNDYQPIDWNLDFKNNYRWNPRTFFKWIRYGNIEGADIIVPWEQSRFQNRMALAQAFILKNDSIFPVEFQNQITDWIENNNFGFGVNWVCAMDTSIRAANWLVIKELFETKFKFSEEFLLKFYGSIYDHGRHIRKNLLRSKNITTNHYVSGIAGLLFIALYCPFFKKSKEWLDFAVNELENEVKRQVYPDGCDYEASTSYHLLVLEIFFYTLLLCDRAKIPLSESYKDKVKKMFEVVLYYLKPNGIAPQIGDNDNGRFFKLSNRHLLDQTYLLNLAVIYFKDNKFKLKGSKLEEESFWLFGQYAKIIWDSLTFRKSPLTSRSYPDAGWYIIRHGNSYCFITCGPNGQRGKGGHAHNDKLSFELMIDGHDIFVDPGTYVYTPYPLERNKFRSTEYHNTIKFDGYEQNEIPEIDMFSLPDKVEIKEASLRERNNSVFFQGEIKYACFTHKRMVTFNKILGSLHIKDSFSCTEPLKGKLIFHLSPNLTTDGNNIFIKETKNKIATIEITGSKIEIEKYDYSSGYGTKEKSDCLVAEISAAKDIRNVNTCIYKS